MDPNVSRTTRKITQPMMPRYLTALPVFNEESHIQGVLDEVLKFSPDVLVVDDGSTDGTPRILRRLSGIRLVTHEANSGYGAALRSAFDYAVAEGFDVLVTIDCDGQHEPSLIPEIAAAVYSADDGPIDIVSGSRYLTKFAGDSLPPEDRRRVNMTITQRLNDELRLNLTDSFCGFKAYRVSALEKLEVTELGYAMPLPIWVQVAELGLRVVEFPVPLVYLEEERSFGGSLDDARRRMAYYNEVIDREIASASFPRDAAPKSQDIGSVRP